ncbi:MAG: c-type cytochrome biogenesis protein CcsB [Proteobacteria bacterium]|nr:c-type cytochrome biogenesis protein CcsB [Pseudomonadota bacterium]
MSIENFYYITLFFTVFSSILFFGYLITLKKTIGDISLIIFSLSTIAIFFYLVLRGVKGGYFPVSNTHEGLVFFALLCSVFFLIFYLRNKILILGVFLSPLVTILTLIAGFTDKSIGEILPILQSFWFPIHVVSAFIGNALFALSFVVSLVYLIENFRLKKKKFDVLGKLLPSITMLDTINYFCIVYGFPFLTLGMITGAIWAQVAIGSYWNNDPKEIWSLFTWFIYAALLHTRLISGWRGKKIAFLSILAFLFLVFSFIGVKFLFKGYHVFETIR